MTEHPVIWLEVSHQYDESKVKDSLQSMREDVLKKLPEEEKGDDRNVLCITNEHVLNSDGKKGAVYGAEADVGIVDAYYYNLESVSRARKQLFIVTYENDYVIRLRLNEALENERLVKKHVTYAELQNGRWWNKVKKDETGKEGKHKQALL